MRRAASWCMLTAVTRPGPDDDPLELFLAWYDHAVSSGARDPDAVTLATVGPGGSPRARVVLYKGVSAERLVFYTNYESDKARELAAEPRAALVFHWRELARQVRVEGRAERLTPGESDAYFATRPRLAQLGAHASLQSRPLPSRQVFAERMAELEERFRDLPVPRPEGWGGYGLLAARWELWIGHEYRLHERYVYSREATSWSFATLYP